MVGTKTFRALFIERFKQNSPLWWEQKLCSLKGLNKIHFYDGNKNF